MAGDWTEERGREVRCEECDWVGEGAVYDDELDREEKGEGNSAGEDPVPAWRVGHQLL